MAAQFRVGDEFAAQPQARDRRTQVVAQGGGKPPAPGDMQSKINDLISNEVSDGKLTSDQAAELKNVFAQTFQNGPGGPGGPGGQGGPDTPGGPGGGAGGSSAASSSNSDVSQVLSDFLKLLQDSQGGSSSYGASGDSLISQIQSLVVNHSA